MKNIVFENVKKAYGKNVVVEDLCMEVKEGERLILLGPSGCGKSTTLRMIAGLENVTAGNLWMRDQVVNDVPCGERGVSMVFQNYALFENMTVRRNIEYAMKLRPALRAKASQRATELMERVGLTEHAEKYPAQLSGGQQQRVAIARTLALSPAIILFDEPMSALDVETRLALRRELKTIQKDLGTTMIYITHDQEEAFALSDRIMVMGNAKIHQLDTPAQILDAPANEYVRRFVIDNLKAKIDSLAKYMR